MWRGPQKTAYKYNSRILNNVTDDNVAVCWIQASFENRHSFGEVTSGWCALTEFKVEENLEMMQTSVLSMLNKSIEEAKKEAEELQRSLQSSREQVESGKKDMQRIRDVLAGRDKRIQKIQAR